MLFDGTAESLEEWHMSGPGGFTLEADCSMITFGGLACCGTPSRSRATTASARLEIPAMTTAASSSASPTRHRPVVAVDTGYEIQIDATDDPDRPPARSTTSSPPDRPRATPRSTRPAVEPFEIKVDGQRIRIYLNDEKVNDFTSPDNGRTG